MTTETNRKLQKLIANGRIEIDQGELTSSELALLKEKAKSSRSHKFNQIIRFAVLASAILTPAFICDNDPGMISAKQHMTQIAKENPGLPLSEQQKTLDAQNGVTEVAPTLTPEATAEPEKITEKYTVKDGDTLIDLYYEFLYDKNLTWDNNDKVTVYNKNEVARASYRVRELKDSELILNIDDMVVFEDR